MPRVKRGTTHAKKRRKILKAVKGYRHGRKKLIKLAKVAILKAGQYAYRDRRTKKRTVRRLWQIKLNAAVRVFELSYSKFIHALKTNKVELDRKVLADLAEHNTEIFAKIVDKVKPVKTAPAKAEAVAKPTQTPAGAGQAK
jgi:large subunit ribosomal protein L20